MDKKKNNELIIAIIVAIVYFNSRCHIYML